MEMVQKMMNVGITLGAGVLDGLLPYQNKSRQAPSWFPTIETVEQITATLLMGSPVTQQPHLSSLVAHFRVKKSADGGKMPGHYE